MSILKSTLKSKPPLTIPESYQPILGSSDMSSHKKVCGGWRVGGCKPKMWYSSGPNLWVWVHVAFFHVPSTCPWTPPHPSIFEVKWGQMPHSPQQFISVAYWNQQSEDVCLVLTVQRFCQNILSENWKKLTKNGIDHIPSYRENCTKNCCKISDEINVVFCQTSSPEIRWTNNAWKPEEDGEE